VACAIPLLTLRHKNKMKSRRRVRKEKARRRGLLGETYGYWYLRRQG
jgi:hypothetical protein